MTGRVVRSVPGRHRCTFPTGRLREGVALRSTAEVGTVWQCSCGRQWVLRRKSALADYWRRKWIPVA